MTDETEVSLGQKPNSKNDIIWAPKGADVTPVDVDQYPRTLRFWAGASAKGRTKLHFFNHNWMGMPIDKFSRTRYQNSPRSSAPGHGFSSMMAHQHTEPKRRTIG